MQIYWLLNPALIASASLPCSWTIFQSTLCRSQHPQSTTSLQIIMAKFTHSSKPKPNKPIYEFCESLHIEPTPLPLPLPQTELQTQCPEHIHPSLLAADVSASTFLAITFVRIGGKQYAKHLHWPYMAAVSECTIAFPVGVWNVLDENLQHKRFFFWPTQTCAVHSTAF